MLASEEAEGKDDREGWEALWSLSDSDRETLFLLCPNYLPILLIAQLSHYGVEYDYIVLWG